jgi:hypothetical protein
MAGLDLYGISVHDEESAPARRLALYAQAIGLPNALQYSKGLRQKSTGSERSKVA